jgi:hypothetical protein
MVTKTREITIDPKIFISPPYLKCPKCSATEYGVLMISRRNYRRKCGACKHSKSFKLPSLNKKIVYLDQMAISEMMKVLHPKVSQKTKGKVKKIWKTLFEKLDRLVKLQLIICPDSTTHLKESLVMIGYYESLRRMYEQLSNGTSFHDENTIKRFQITADFRKWLGEKDVNKIKAADVIQGEGLNGWQDRLRISVDLFKSNEELIKQFKKERDDIDLNMKQVFKRWQSEKSKQFKDWFNEEKTVFGPIIIRSYLENIVRIDEHFFPSTHSVVLSVMQRILKEHGFKDEELLNKCFEYLKSDSIKEIPVVSISAGLYASIARKAAAGQKKPPTKGAVNDISIISSLSPYCDAMFIDNEFNSLLKENINGKPVKEVIGVKAKLFSQRNIGEFISYLNEIEKSASVEHIKKVIEVYGDSWGKPFVEMYDYD